MKLFTNKWLLVLSVCACVTACSSKDEASQAAVAVTQTVTVQEPVLPPSAEKLAPEKPAEEKAQAVVVSKPVTKTPSSSNDPIAKVKMWDSKLKFLKTRFEQNAQYDGVPVSKSQGILYYDQAKHMLRLDTTDTDGNTEQTAITDKDKILILDNRGNEITTLSWQEWQQGQPNQALFDFGNYTALLARHNAVLKEPYVLELTPKEGEKYTLYLTLSQEDYFPQKIKIVSDLMITEAVLGDIQKNTALAFDTFRAGGLFK